MAEIADLTKHLEAHPDDHETRWRLAKKFYKAAEYRAALRHLKYLDKHWLPKLNVARYLAATYYRLCRYDEAVEQLKTALRVWPEEIPLREQLARVYEITGLNDQATTIWEEVLRIKPEHSLAKQALSRLKRPSAARTDPPTPLKDKDFGISDSLSGVPCPTCGSVNSEDFERCWKCNTPIRPGLLTPTPPPAMPVRQRRGPEPHLVMWTHVATAGAAIAIAGAAYLTLTGYLAQTPGSALTPICTVNEVVRSEMYVIRLVLGLLLLLGWPLALWMAVALTTHIDIPARSIVATGALFGALAWLALWLPLNWLPPALVAVAALSFAPIIVLFGTPPPQSLAIGAIQTFIILCAFFVTCVFQEGMATVTGFPAVLRYSSRHDAGPTPGVLKLDSASTPIKLSLSWESSGSPWFDGKAARTVFEITSEKAGALVVELLGPSETVFYKHLDKSPYIFAADIAPGQHYTLNITGGERIPVDIVIKGALKPKVG